MFKKALLLCSLSLSPLVMSADLNYLDGSSSYLKRERGLVNSRTPDEGYFVGYTTSTTRNIANCSSSGTLNKVVWEVVALYIEQHPERRHLSNDDLIIEAVNNSWCNK